MKIGDLAGILEKPAEELATSLNVEDTESDLDSAVVSKVIQDHLKEAKRAEYQKGKTQGEGKAVREVKTTYEKRLREFGIEGEDLDHMFDAVKEKINSSGDQSEKSKLVIEQLKNKAKELEDKLTAKEKADQEKEKYSFLYSKIEPLLDKFEGTVKAKKLAVESYLKTVNVTIEDGEVYFEKSNKVFETDATNYLQELFEPKSTEKKPPENPKDNRGQFSSKTRQELREALRNAKTAEERAEIAEQLKTLKD